jgi:hypothetical protein
VASSGIGGMVAFQASQACRRAARRCGLAAGQVGAFACVLVQVEQVVVAVDPQVLERPVAQRALAAVVHAPVQRPRHAVAGVVQQRQQRDAVQRVRRVGGHASGRQQRGGPVHGHAGLVADAAWRDDSGPLRHPGHTDTAFGEVHLAADQRPVVAEALTAVVAGEHHQGVVELAGVAQRLQHPADALVHVVDHAAVLVDVAAVQVEQVAAHLGGQGLVVARFPGPVGGGVVQAEQEGPAAGVGGAIVHIGGGALRQQIGEVALFVPLCLVGIQVVAAVVAAVGEVVDPAGHRPEEGVVTRFQRAEGRRVAQVPLADQRRVVPGLAQQ